MSVRSQESVLQLPASSSMDTDAYSCLAAIREALSDEQRELIDMIERELDLGPEADLLLIGTLTPGPMISKKRVHHAIGRAKAQRVASELGGTIVNDIDRSSDSSDSYGLSCLGLCLSSRGRERLELLQRHVGYLVERFRANPDVHEVSGADIGGALELNRTELLELVVLLRAYDSPWRVSRIDHLGWSASVPHDIDEIAEARDLHACVESRLVGLFDPNCPFSSMERLVYAQQRHRTAQFSGKFRFVTHVQMREQIESDWNEVERVQAASAWKATMILCGGILEGCLLSVLSDRLDLIRSQSSQLASLRLHEDYRRWTLSQLIEVAGKLSLLRGPTVYACHALREYRNLIHPDRQVTQMLGATKRQASIARSAVAEAIEDLQRLGS